MRQWHSGGARRRVASLYPACSGAVLLAETGLLDGCCATSHRGWVVQAAAFPSGR